MPRGRRWPGLLGMLGLFGNIVTGRTTFLVGLMFGLLALLALTSDRAIRHTLRGEQQTEPGREFTADPGQVDAMVAGWPAAPKKGAQQMIEQYGPPNEATPTKLIWYRNRPWKRTVVSSDEIVHNFPTGHSDFLTL